MRKAIQENAWQTTEKCDANCKRCNQMEIIADREVLRSLTDGGDVRRVKFVVREPAQQTCFADPGISEKQESEEHIVLLGHGAAGCGAAGWRNCANPEMQMDESCIAGPRLRCSTCSVRVCPQWASGAGEQSRDAPASQAASSFQWVRWTMVNAHAIRGKLISATPYQHKSLYSTFNLFV